MWKSMTDAARQSFCTSAVPGEAYGEIESVEDINHKESPPPDNFLLVLLVPTSVDYLRLTHMYRQMDRFVNGTWTLQRVHP